MAQVNYNQPSPPPSGGGGGGHAGIYAVLIIVVLLILAAVFYFGGVFGPATEQGADFEADINIEQPSRPDLNIQLPDTITID